MSAPLPLPSNTQNVTVRPGGAPIANATLSGPLIVSPNFGNGTTGRLRRVSGEHVPPSGRRQRRAGHCRVASGFGDERLRERRAPDRGR